MNEGRKVYNAKPIIFKRSKAMNFIKTRAAVAWAPKQPLVIEELASAIPMPTPWTGWTRKASSPASSAMRARAWWSRSAKV